MKVGKDDGDADDGLGEIPRDSGGDMHGDDGEGDMFLLHRFHKGEAEV